MKFYSI